MEELEPYKSLRTTIFEVQAAAKPTKPAERKPSAQPAHKSGEVWKTASGSFGAKNKDGVVDYFDSEENAKAWVGGQFKPAGRVEKPGDTSVPVELDRDGYEVQQTAGGKPANAKPAAAAATRPAPQPTGRAAPKAQATASNTQHQAQPQSSQASAAEPEEHPEVGKTNPKTEFDPHIKLDPKATEKAKAKPDIRKANVVAKAVKAGDLDGPQTDAESVFGDAAAEQRFVEEMNHAALSAMRGEAAYDFELCSEVFAHLGLCFDPQTKEKVTKGIPRDQMPQFSSQVDPSRTDSPAFIALMRGKGYTSPDQVTPEDLKSEVNMEREFRKALEDAGYEIADEEVSVTSLKPIQGQLKGEKIAGMYGTLAAAQSDPQNYGKSAARLLEPIYVSDGYVIDGHHRWAAQVAMDIANGAGANATMKTRTITKGGKSVPVEEIIAFSNKFQKDIGLLSQTRGGETIPEKKPKTQKEWTMGKFGSKRVQNIVESLNEAAKAKFKKPKIEGDQPDTFGYGARVQRGGSVGGKMGVKPISLAQQVNRDARAASAVQKNQKTAADLMKTIESKPEGTTFEIYGSRDGKETSVKVKKVRSMGDVVYMVGNSRVELRVSGVGLKVVNPKTNRTMLDRGADLIWESADFCDVGRITITELNQTLYKDSVPKTLAHVDGAKKVTRNLGKIDAERRKKAMAAKDAAINKRVADAKASSKMK
jgi:hypothetical protein